MSKTVHGEDLSEEELTALTQELCSEGATAAQMAALVAALV